MINIKKNLKPLFSFRIGESTMKKTKILLLIGLLTMILLVSSVSAEKATSLGNGPFSEFRLTANDPVPAAEFGRSVAIDGNLVAVGAGGATADSVVNAGAVYLYKRQGLVYVPEAKLVAEDASSGAEFGRTVAIKGNMVIVGARFAKVGDLSTAGAAYVYRKYQGSWHFEEKITSPTPANEDNFGRALAVQGDLLVVTARKESTGAQDVGAAYVYVYRDGIWTYQSKLTASDASSGAYFGQSVALQGNKLAIGARNADPNGAGAVYLFHRSGNVWVEDAKVVPSDGKKNDQFGFTIAISGDMMTVGARRADLKDGVDAGAVYVFSLKGDSVKQVIKLTASDTVAGDEFGQSVAFAGDVIAVGAWKVDIDEDNADQGSIYLFRRMGDQWIETDKITASDGIGGDEFGYSLAAFGNRMVTGAHFADSTAGAAYVLPLKS